jgi:hypothetical protein
MSAAPLPDFERTLALTQGNLEACELSECHGIACGLLCRLADASVDSFIRLLGMLELLHEPSADCGCLMMTKRSKTGPWHCRNGAAVSLQVSVAAAKMH